MSRKLVFLRANWNHLIMANYPVDPVLLLPYLPEGTRLDTFGGVHYVSIVGFLFEQTRLFGCPIPFFSLFEEVNLRFYVCRQEGETIKRGTVFISEIVPKRLIPWVANTLYNEQYSTMEMNHTMEQLAHSQRVGYGWKSKSGWNSIQVEASLADSLPHEDSLEWFITQHYWGYNPLRQHKTLEYGVEHIPWEVFPVIDHQLTLYPGELYGPSFVDTLSAPPSSVFLAKGSDVLVRTPSIFRPLKEA